MQKLPKPFKPSKAYWSAYGELYGDPVGKIKKEIKTSPRACNAVKCPTELREQINLCNWMDKSRILYFAIPNGGSRHMLEALNLKRSGVKRGVPDICIPVASQGYHGLYIELKRVKGGKISIEQTQWLDNLSYNGYKATVAYGCDHAQQIISEYFGDHDPASFNPLPFSPKIDEASVILG